LIVEFDVTNRLFCTTLSTTSVDARSTFVKVFSPPNWDRLDAVDYAEPELLWLLPTRFPTASSTILASFGALEHCETVL
jgi:hypothetical protein